MAKRWECFVCGQRFHAAQAVVDHVTAHLTTKQLFANPPGPSVAVCWCGATVGERGLLLASHCKCVMSHQRSGGLFYYNGRPRGSGYQDIRRHWLQCGLGLEASDG